MNDAAIYTKWQTVWFDLEYRVTYIKELIAKVSCDGRVEDYFKGASKTGLYRQSESERDSESKSETESSSEGVPLSISSVRAEDFCGDSSQRRIFSAKRTSFLAPPWNDIYYLFMLYFMLKFTIKSIKHSDLYNSLYTTSYTNGIQ